MLFSPAVAEFVFIGCLCIFDLYFKQSLNINASTSVQRNMRTVVYSGCDSEKVSIGNSLTLQALRREHVKFHEDSIRVRWNYCMALRVWWIPKYRDRQLSWCIDGTILITGLVMSGHYPHGRLVATFIILAPVPRMTWGDYGISRDSIGGPQKRRRLNFVENSIICSSNYVYDDSTAGPMYVRDLLERGRAR